MELEPRPRLKIPYFCRVCTKLNVYAENMEYSQWMHYICPDCESKINLKLQLFLSGKDNYALRDDKPEDDVKPQKANVNWDGKQAYFITLTSKEDVTEEELEKRLNKILSSSVFVVDAYYACIEKTKNDRNHMHVILCYNLKRDHRGKLKYPSESYFKTINKGEFIDKKRIADRNNIQNVINYVEKDSGKKFGDRSKVIEFY